ncbi:MAG: cation-translocating P-type ATPase [Microgenomates group bacterium]
MEHVYTGLSATEAALLVKENGYNELPSQKSKSVFSIIWSVISEPMIFLLICAGTVYFLLGEPKDAIALAISVVFLVGITFLQEKKTEKTLQALRNLASPRALVIRDGERIRISGREVVCGDIVVLHEGDRVPADAYVLSDENLLVDESILTGESQPVKKSVWNQEAISYKAGGVAVPYVFSGTLIIAGHGEAQVAKTGSQTEMGKIGKALESIRQEDTLLRKETGRIVKNLAISGIILCLFVLVLYTLRYGNLLQGFLSGLTLSMAILPEEFPVVLLIFMTLGAWRLSKRHVLTRNNAVIETLGAATVLCVDKTGTITENRMKLEVICIGQQSFRVADQTITPEENYLIELSVLASQKNPYDPIERELIRIKQQKRILTEDRYSAWQLVKEYPLSKDIFAVTHVWQSPDGKKQLVVSKGAPEAILDLCHATKKLRSEILQLVETMSHDGLRILAVAQTLSATHNVPEKPNEFTLTYEGLLGFADPIRTTVPQAIKTAYAAGIRTIMITGDYPGTATYIARQAGLVNPDVCMMGDEIETMSHSELREKINTVNLFARVIPEQKLHIIEALKANGEIVAMTGDGVNDAPALKSAHIGISMGERGTDVAREASDIVLLNDDFSSIVSAVRLGRRIFDNLKRAMRYLLAVHIPIIVLSVLPVVFGYPLILFPAHIAFLELIIDPACSTVFEGIGEQDHIMRRPPRKLTDPLFNSRIIIVGLIQGISVSVALSALYIYLMSVGKNEIDARTITFVALVISNLLLIVGNVTWSQNTVRILLMPNKLLWWVIGGALTGIVFIIFVAPLKTVFHLGALKNADLVLLLVFVLGVAVWLEIAKLVWKKIFKRFMTSKNG